MLGLAWRPPFERRPIIEIGAHALWLPRGQRLVLLELPTADADVAEFSKHLGLEFGGLLGADVLARIVLEADWTAGTAAVHDPATYRPGPALKWEAAKFDRETAYVAGTFDGKTTGLFAFASGIYHNYYVAELAPAVAALVGIGVAQGETCPEPSRARMRHQYVPSRLVGPLQTKRLPVRFEALYMTLVKLKSVAISSEQVTPGWSFSTAFSQRNTGVEEFTIRSELAIWGGNMTGDTLM